MDIFLEGPFSGYNCKGRSSICRFGKFGNGLRNLCVFTNSPGERSRLSSTRMLSRKVQEVMNTGLVSKRKGTKTGGRTKELSFYFHSFSIDPDPYSILPMSPTLTCSSFFSLPNPLVLFFCRTLLRLRAGPTTLPYRRE